MFSQSIFNIFRTFYSEIFIENCKTFSSKYVIIYRELCLVNNVVVKCKRFTIYCTHFENEESVFVFCYLKFVMLEWDFFKSFSVGKKVILKSENIYNEKYYHSQELKIENTHVYVLH